jgi:transcriptional regulator NrdR family protein
MICPTCNAWTRTLETREKPGHTTYRRYECANLHRFSTMEAVVQLLRGPKPKERTE